VKEYKKLVSRRAAAEGFAVHPQRFVFFDRKTGARRFEVQASEDGSLPVHQAASLLAIQCAARQQTPRDFGVMVEAGEDLVGGLIDRVTQLLGTCAEPKAPVLLSRRQHEVLSAVAQNLSNKEIAGMLNVSVRTVKFHVSALLEKFEVRGRVDLMLEANDLLNCEFVHKRPAVARSAHSYASGMAPTLSVPSLRPRLLAPMGGQTGRG
jgi:DNA-binding CsgD family transcriptional regulator